MRRLQIATLLFTTVLITSIGCRQTFGPSTAGSVPPGSISPAAQSPTFNPFGGATRVTPPPAGTSAAQNPYIGGPPGQTNFVSGTANGFAAVPGAGTTAPVVGSGIQPAGFVGSDAGVAPATQAGFGTNRFSSSVGTNMPSGVAQTGYGAAVPSSTNAIRAGGMPVNDLTRAPLPPGYRGASQGSPQPMPPTYQPSVSTLAPTAFGPNVAPMQPAFTPVLPPSVPTNGFAPAVNVNGFQQPQQGATLQRWQRTGTSPVPAAEIASHMVPVTPGTAPAAPTAQGDTDRSDLLWRRPGSQRF